MKKRVFSIFCVVFIIAILQFATNISYANTVNKWSDVNVKLGKAADGYLEYGKSNTFIFMPDKIGKLTISINCYVNDAISASLYSDYNIDNPLIIGSEYNDEKGYTTMTYEVLVSPRTYYLKLTNPIIVLNGKIHITTKFTERESCESSKLNHSESGAITLSGDNYYHGVLAFDEVEDYYVFNLKKKEQLKFTVFSKNDEATDVIFKNSKGDIIKKDFICGDSRKYDYTGKLAAGKYYLVINKGSQITQSGRTYAISTGKFKMITKISIPKSKSLQVGDTFYIKPSITPKDAIEEYSYTSSNPKIAKVSSDGKITALKKGTATITLLTDEGKLKKTCKITVKGIAVKSIRLNKTNTELTEGERVVLSATISPSNASDKKVLWTSSDNKVASVSSDGKVTAQGIGTCKVTAKIGSVNVSCTIKVVAKRVVKATPIPSPTQAPKQESIDVNSISMLSSLNIYIGNTKSVNDLMAVVTPDNATDKTLTWSSTDNSIVSIDGGIITPKKVGTARIVVSSKNGKKAYCTVVVKESE